MDTTTLIWTAVPGGILPNGKLRLSVLVSPRLVADPQTANPTLAQFGPFRTWVSTVKFMSFRVAFAPPSGSSTPAPPIPVSTVVKAQPWILDLSLWRALFPDDRPVRSFGVSDLGSRPLRSFPTASLATGVEQPYQDLAAPSEAKRVREIPTAAEMQASRLSRDFTLDPAEREAIRNRLNAKLATQGYLTQADAPDLKSQIVLAEQFHQSDLPTSTPPPPRTPTLDVHDLVSSLTEYPEMARRLGLIVDLDIDISGIQGIREQGRVRVLPALSVNATSAAPWTEYEMSAAQQRFAARVRPDDADHVDGMLRLSDPNRFQIGQIDAGAEALRAMDFANRVRTVLARNAGDESTPPPALNSAGIMVTRPELAQQMKATFERSKGWEENVFAPATDGSQVPGGNVSLFADDLVRGYRVDVLDHDSGANPDWKSLCRREGSYTVVATGQNIQHSDEGAATLSATAPISAGEGTVPRELRLHEALFVWQNWSLCAPRPGKGLSIDGTAGAGNPASAHDGLAVQFSPSPGSLPALRFGRKYRVRARINDLVGGGLPADAGAVPAAESPDHVYRRFEPVPPPTLVPTQPKESISRGEQLDVLVIRSSGDPAGFDGKPCERFVAPPATSVALAEAHGLFDGADGRPDSGRYALIRDRQGSLPEHADALDTVPYLPDPLARAAAMIGLPGLPTGTLLAPKLQASGEDVANARAFRVRVGNGVSAPQLDEASRTLELQVPPATVWQVELSSQVEREDLKLLGIWGLIENAPNRSDLETIALEGGHQMLTPSRRITLVHAVAKPQIAPAFGNLRAQDRTLDQAEVQLTDHQTTLDPFGTLKLDILARWTDVVDAPDTDRGLREVTSQGFAFKVDVPAIQGMSVPPPLDVKGVHRLPDTRRRTVRYRAVATSRFGEFFPEGTDLTRESAEVALPIRNSGRPAGLEVVSLVPTFGWEPIQRTTAAVTRTRRGRGIRVYFRGPWNSTGEGELVGVIVARESQFASVSTDLSSLVTQWGADPARTGSAAPPPDPSLTDLAESFPRMVERQDALTLKEAPAKLVDVAGHEPAYDRERGLWYCDFEIDTGDAYFPFVRLALARFQPFSIPGAHLGPVRLADFTQVAPDRTAAIERFNPSDPRDIRVSVFGPAPAAVSGISAATEMTARLERNAPADGGAWTPVGDAVPLTELDAGGSVRWSATTRLPSADSLPTGTRLRFSIREMERHATDEVASKPVRTVYVDQIEI